MARLVGLEPTTPGLEDRFSIQLRYRRFVSLLSHKRPYVPPQLINSFHACLYGF